MRNAEVVDGKRVWRSYFNYPSYWVTLDEPKKQTRWGPFQSEEEAIQVSGFPKPKTEIEELWEWAGAARELLVTALDKTGDPRFLSLLSDWLKRFSNLEAKWKK